MAKKLFSLKKYKAGPVWVAAIAAVMLAAAFLNLAAAATYRVVQSGSARSGDAIAGQVVSCNSGSACTVNGTTVVNRSNQRVNVTTTVRSVRVKSESAKCRYPSSCKTAGVTAGVTAVNNVGPSLMQKLTGRTNDLEVNVAPVGGSRSPDVGCCVTVIQNASGSSGRTSTITSNASRGTSGSSTPSSIKGQVVNIICGAGQVCRHNESVVVNGSDTEATVSAGPGEVAINRGGSSSSCVAGQGQICSDGAVVAVNRLPNFNNIEPHELTTDLTKYVETVKDRQLTCKSPRVVFIYDLTSLSFFGSGRYNFFYNDLCVLHF